MLRICGHRVGIAGLFVWLIWFGAACPGDDTRYQLGKRVQRFEMAFERDHSSEVRRRTLPHLKQAVTAFFGMDLARASRGLDLATVSIPETPHSRGLESLHSLNLSLTSRVIPTEARTMALRLKRAYPVADGPVSGSVRVELEREGSIVAQTQMVFDELPVELVLPVDALAEGDYRLKAVVQQESETLELPFQAVSILKEPEERLQRLAAAVKSLPESLDETVRTTLRDNTRMIQRLLNSDNGETDFPVSRLLQEAESLVGQCSVTAEPRLWTAAGQYWLTLSSRGRTTRARVCLPDRAVPARGDDREVQEPKPCPLVIALHGAGGSENMFFDAYGAGKIVRLCQERGWILVAPGSTPLGNSLDLVEMTAVLSRHSAVDRRRVCVVGHSMGAMQALRLVARTPGAASAIAILGGGQKVRNTGPFDKIPLFAGAGSDDFGRGGVLQVVRQWEEAMLPVTSQTYPDIEHLAVVQVALEDVFLHFDQAVQRAVTGD